MQSNRIYREHETSFVCKIAGQERSFCVRKIRRTYNKLNSMAFVANARPEQSDTHACSLNKGIGWESRTWKESAAPRNLWIWDWTDAGRILKIAVFLKHCFRAKKICVRWKPVIGGAVMALREGWSNALAVRREIVSGDQTRSLNRWVRRPTNHRNERNLREKARVISAYPAHKGDG